MVLIEKLVTIVVVVILLIPALFIFGTLSDLVINVSIPEGTILWVQGAFSMGLLIILILVFILGIIAVFMYWSPLRKQLNVSKKRRKIIRVALIALTVTSLLFVYLTTTDATFFTSEQIIHRSPFHPTSTTYNYSDIDQVTTGFSSKGDFYYKVHLYDGPTINLLNSGRVNEDLVETGTLGYDSYEEIVMIDNWLMDLGIPKIASEEYASKNSMELVYENRLLQIIRNQP